jgi:4-amino-4-deoxy-L-arabinose transferase-like glycosyltransferase
MLPTSVAMLGFARAASPDMLFAGLLTASLCVAIEILQKPRPGPLLRVAFGFFLGAAVLAKGPAAVILAGGATLVWAALSRQWTAPFRFLHPLIIAVFCAVSLPWYILCALRNPDFLNVFIWQHNFQRFLTPIFEHRQPFWFFVPVFLLGILPWLPLLVTMFMDAVRNRSFETQINSPALFIACWSLFTLVFFSLSQSKLPGYILPAIPPAVLLLARSLSRQIERNTKGIRLAIIFTGFVFPLLTGISLAWIKKLSFGAGFNPTQGVQVAFALAVIGWVVIVGYALASKWNRAGSAVACTMVILLCVANRMVLPGLDARLSARPAAEKILKHYPATTNEIAVYHLPRAFRYELNYYFGKELPEWAPENTAATIIFYQTNAMSKLGEPEKFDSGRLPDGFISVPATPDGKISTALRANFGK